MLLNTFLSLSSIFANMFLMKLFAVHLRIISIPSFYMTVIICQTTLISIYVHSTSYSLFCQVLFHKLLCFLIIISSGVLGTLSLTSCLCTVKSSNLYVQGRCLLVKRHKPSAIFLMFIGRESVASFIRYGEDLAAAVADEERSEDNIQNAIPVIINQQ